jgi:hypothetical protein
MEYEFWESSDHKCPIKEFLKEVQKRDSKAIGRIFKILDLLSTNGLPFMMEARYADKFKFKSIDIYEIRISFNKTQYRLLGGIVNSKLCLNHGFIKKSQKTKKSDLDCAINRLRIKYK